MIIDLPSAAERCFMFMKKENPCYSGYPCSEKKEYSVFSVDSMGDFQITPTTTASPI